ncbi:SoxR reducing system RseC family protein [Halomonas llamarensis]|uniref:SoxR reducing system RseC family protein n=1 Tax=Halomonas llamarensis TaxID=2945104 RepID=A0ABT0SLX6_9GAMM|nr:SoxR reducing system RseC family protein [Halomonas llamarensis]MCL7928803.1 SoxR reducing system RseC family protein [Halomonas llamarensis]
MALASCALSTADLYRDATVVGYSATGLRVEVQAGAGCERCQKGGGCGAGLLQRSRHWQVDVPVGHNLEAQKQRELDVLFPLGGHVRLRMPRRSLMHLALWVYALPLLVAMTCVGLLSVAEMASQWNAPAVFFAALIATAVVFKFKNRRDAERFRPRLVN